MHLQPQEIEVWYVLPAIRREVCKRLVARGLSQRDAAKLLGLTEAAVSQYFKSKRAAKVRFDRKFTELTEKICEQIADKKLPAYAGVQQLAISFRRSGCMCALHRRMEKVPAGCAQRLAGVCGE